MHFTESVENADAWEQRRLGDLANIYDGVHQTPKYLDKVVMFLSVENISTLQSNKFISQEAFERDYKNYPQYGDILMTRIGNVGTPNVYSSNEKVAFYVSLALIKPHNIDSWFLCNSIKSNFVQNELSLRTLKTAIPMKINKDEIGQVGIIFPKEHNEQKKIGTLLKSLDTLITLHQRLHFGITINHLKNPNAWEQHELWKLTIWDKKFNEVDKEKQPETRKYRYALADAINLIIIPGGDIKILSTGSLDAYTTKERAGEYLCNGEIVAIPWGGTPNIKYAKGFFVTGDNRIATSNDLDKLNNRYLYWWFNTPLKHLENIYRGASIKHPSMNDVLNMTIQLPSIPEQKKIIDLLDNIDSLLTFISKCSFTHIIKIFEFTYTIERSLFCFTTFHIIISVSLISKIAMFLFLLIQKQPLGIMFFYI